MSVNILAKFPGLTYNDVRVVPYETSFTATVGAVTPGTFTWQANSAFTGNGQSFAHDAVKGHYYHLDSYTLSSTIDLLKFSNALDSTFQNGFFNFSIFKRFENRPANPSLIRLASYREDSPLALSYGTQKFFPAIMGDPAANPAAQIPEQIYFQITGRLIQTAALVADGVTEITVFLNATIYEILNQDWIGKWFLSKTPPAKKGLALDGDFAQYRDLNRIY